MAPLFRDEMMGGGVIAPSHESMVIEAMMQQSKAEPIYSTKNSCPCSDFLPFIAH
jgi:hypothetical protein